MIYFLVYLITNSIITFILLNYLKENYRTKYQNAIYISFYIAFVVIISIINLFNIPILNLICNSSFFICINHIGFIHEAVADYYKDIIYFFLLIFLDTITFFLTGIIYPSGEEINIFRSLSSSLIVLLCDMIIKRFISFTNIKNVPVKEIIIYLLITIFYVFMMYILSGSYDLLKNRYSKWLIMFFVIGQITVDVIIYYYLNFVGLSYKMEKKVTEARQQSEIKRIYYTNLKKRYEESRQIIHDYKNYIQVLEHIDEEKKDTSHNLKIQLYDALDKSISKYNTSSEILDIILMDKENEATKEQIEFIFRMEFIDISFISEIDIITIFGNLYDNAIEANRQRKKERYIKTYIYKLGETLIIRIENSCDNQLEYAGRKIKSTKIGHHGIGLNNVNEVVKKYNGIFSIKIIEEKCKTLISMPLYESKPIIKTEQQMIDNQKKEN